MIPKIIHYCWFGRSEMPELAQRCIASWHKYMPEYEYRLWNEDNFDVYSVPYTKEAYEAKKYAFVSDYARFWILYNYGGIYFDTDVELINSIDDILVNGPYFGCENDGKINQSILVNPGLGCAAFPKMQIYERILNHYNQSRFIRSEGLYDLTTVVTRTTNILKEFGLKNINSIQNIKDINIFPSDYFNPLNDNTGQLIFTDNTRSIHWYSKTWQTSRGKIRGYFTRPFHRFFGDNCFNWLKKIFNK